MNMKFHGQAQGTLETLLRPRSWRGSPLAASGSGEVRPTQKGQKRHRAEAENGFIPPPEAGGLLRRRINSSKPPVKMVIAAFILLEILCSRPLLLSAAEPIEQEMPPSPSFSPSLIVPVSEKPDAPPLTLPTCFRMALRQSETIAIRREDIKQTQADFLNAASEALGDINFLITDFRQDAPRTNAGGDSSVGSTLSAYDRRERKLVIEQPLFQGFKALGALTGVGSLRKQRQEELIYAQELLYLDVTSAFYGVLKNDADVKIITQIRDLFKERIRDLKKREKIGRSRLSEIATAQSRMKILESDYAQAKGSLIISKQILEFLTGHTLHEEKLQEDKSHVQELKEPGEYAAFVEKRADVKAAGEAMKTAWRAVIVAQGPLWPQISLANNQYLKREGFQRDIDWDILFKVDVPLFRGGETVAKVKEAVSVWKKAKLHYSWVKRQADLDIRENYQNWLSSLEQYHSLKEAVKAADENFRLQKEEYTRNLVNNLDVLEALETLNQTRREANAAYYNMKINYEKLWIALGSLSLADQGMRKG